MNHSLTTRDERLAEIARRRDTVVVSIEQAREFLMADGDLATPCCHFGPRTSDCVMPAIMLAHVYADSSGDPITLQDLDDAMGVVVNSGDAHVEMLIWDNRHLFGDKYLEDHDIGPFSDDDMERWRETGELPDDEF